MLLVDLVTLDAGSLAFKNSILAAAALALTGSSGRLGACAVSDGELASCANLLSAHAAALREVEAALQPCKALHNIALEDQHNIQTHTFALAFLDRAQVMCLHLQPSKQAKEQSDHLSLASVPTTAFNSWKLKQLAVHKVLSRPDPLKKSRIVFTGEVHEWPRVPRGVVFVLLSRRNDAT